MHSARHQPDSSDTLLGAGGGQRAHITCSALGQHQPPAQHCLKSSPSARDASPCHPPQPLCSGVSREAPTTGAGDSPRESHLWVPTHSTAANPKPWALSLPTAQVIYSKLPTCCKEMFLSAGLPHCQRSPAWPYLQTLPGPASDPASKFQLGLLMASVHHHLVVEKETRK